VFDFDEEADVLYVSFERPQGATDNELIEDGVFATGAINWWM
jgi:uncharacterized protein YuzE